MGEPRRHSTLREGAVTGMLGAASVALWFLAVDTVSGRPLHTPNALGGVLLGRAPGAEVDAAVVAAYTAFHVVAFLAVGVLAAWSTHLAERQPVVLALFAIFFVVFELAWYGGTALLDSTGVLGSAAWWQVAVGNLIAASLMGAYLWRGHPRIRENLDAALSR